MTGRTSTGSMCQWAPPVELGQVEHRADQPGQPLCSSTRSEGSPRAGPRRGPGCRAESPRTPGSGERGAQLVGHGRDEVVLEPSRAWSRSLASCSRAVAASCPRLALQGAAGGEHLRVSSRISITSPAPSGSSSTTDATINRADVEPTAPASRVSTWCTRSASASAPGETSVPVRPPYAGPPLGRVGPEEPSEQALQFADRRRPPPELGVGTLAGTGEHIDELRRLEMSAGPARRQRQPDKEAHVDEHTPEHGVADRVEPVQPEQRVRGKQANPEWALPDEGGAASRYVPRLAAPACTTRRRSPR